MTKAILIPVDGQPELVEYDGYDGLKELCGGLIDCMSWVFDDSPTIYVNDEGKLNGMMPNRAVLSDREGYGWDGGEIHKGDLLDVIFGPAVCVGFDSGTGDDKDITDEEIEKVMSRFGGVYPKNPEGQLSGIFTVLRMQNR